MSLKEAKTRKKCTCLRCGWEWFPRNQESDPATCANQECRSPYWNTPRAYSLQGKPAPTRRRTKITLSTRSTA